MNTIIEAAQIELLSHCNFSCRHCSNANQPRNTLIPFNVCCNWIDQISSYNPKLFVLSGGEPTLYYDLIPIVEYIIERDCLVRINTNGMGLDNILSRLDPSFVSFQISLDGYDDSTFFSVRNNHFFSNVIESICTAKKEGFDVNIKTVLSTYTINEFYKFLELSELIDVPVTFSFMAREGRAERNNDLILSTAEISEFKLRAECYPNISYQQGIFKNDHCPLIYNSDRISVLRVTCIGDVFPCIAMSKANQSLGNLYSKSLCSMMSDFPAYQRKIIDSLYNPICLKCGARRNSPRPGCPISCDYFRKGDCLYDRSAKKI